MAGVRSRQELVEGAGEMVQEAEALASPKGLSSPRTREPIWWMERADSCKLS